MPTSLWRNLGVVALLALGITLLPRGGEVIDVAGTTVQAVFLAALAAAGWRFYRSRKLWLDALGDRDRALLYGAVGAGIFTVAAKGRFDSFGGGNLLWLGVLALCGFGVYWVWRESRRYSI